jgi:hypothetical protein
MSSRQVRSEELFLAPVGLLHLAVEPRVVERGGAATGEIVGEGEIAIQVDPPRRDQRHASENPAARPKRHDHRRRGADPSEKLGGAHVSLCQLREELDRPAASPRPDRRHVLDRPRRLRRSGAERHELHQELGLPQIDVDAGRRTERAVRSDGFDDHPVGEVRHGEARQVFDGSLVVERTVERR